MRVPIAAYIGRFFEPFLPPDVHWLSTVTDYLSLCGVGLALVFVFLCPLLMAGPARHLAQIERAFFLVDVLKVDHRVKRHLFRKQAVTRLKARAVETPVLAVDLVRFQISGNDPLVGQRVFELVQLSIIALAFRRAGEVVVDLDLGRALVFGVMVVGDKVGAVAGLSR